MKIVEAQKLAWDSAFFEKEVGFATVRCKNFEISNKSQFELIYLFSDIKLEDKALPLCIDEKVVFSKIAEKESTNASSIEIYDGPLSQDLINLSIESGIYSRFKRDPKLEPYFERLYGLWIKNSVQGEFADYVLVAKHQNAITGLLTLKLRENFYDIGLVAVSNAYRGRGIAKALLSKAEKVVGYQQEIRVATQLSNEAACNLYRSAGYGQKTITYIYHLWQ
ncbi:MAG: GNAT family N-acetyltransferase [Marinicellaceae bacterium]